MFPSGIVLLAILFGVVIERERGRNRKPFIYSVDQTTMPFDRAATAEKIPMYGYRAMLQQH